MRDIYECDLLIIDDLGTELTNAFCIVPAFLPCLNNRHLRREIHNYYYESVSGGIKGIVTLTESFPEMVMGCTLTGRDIRITKKLLLNRSEDFRNASTRRKKKPEIRYRWFL